jgi:UPF0755 protein
MKTSSKFALGFFVHTATLFVVGSAIAFWWAANEFGGPGPLQNPATIEIPQGTSLNGIAAKLHEAGAIEKPYVFILGTRLLNAAGDLQAGEFEIEAHASPATIMDKLRKGDAIDRRVTIREGLTSYEVVGILKNVKELKGEITGIPDEGTLLPQTYDFRKSEPRTEVLERMKRDMTSTVDELWPGRAENLPFNTPLEAVILASIVEKETGVASERKRVAGVFINRLKKGIALQTDPSVIYGITKGRPQNEGLGPLGRRLLRADFEVDTPYNTYMHRGLPPGPIANPGRESIEAVLHPEEHDYIYFVADGTGGHVFASTLEEHNKNVAKWRAIRREQSKN